MKLPSVSLCSVPVTTASESMIVTEVETAIQEARSLFITTPNPEIVVDAQNHTSFVDALRNADIALPDGTGVVLALRMRGISVSRIRGREFFETLLGRANTNKWKVVVLGASAISNKRSVEKIQREYPDISLYTSVDARIVIDETGVVVPITGRTEAQLIAEIRTFAPHLLFVAFGHPKQELWVDRVRNNFPGTTIMTIGGTLDTFSGTVPSAPSLLSSLGLEWLFRLAVQPARWRRIITATVLFPFMVLNKR